LTLLKNKKFLLFAFCLISLLAYYPARNAGIVTDFLGWLYKYKEGSYADVINCFGYVGHHQFFHLINYSIFKTIGVSHFGWYFIFALFHGLNGYLLYLLSERWFNRWEIKLPYASIFIALLFLLSPYQVETLTWKACFHYIMSVGLCLSGFLYLLRYLERANRRDLIIVHILFLCALFTLEINLATPFIYLLFILADYYRNPKGELKNKVFHVFLVQFVFIVLYFLLNKFSLGEWVGHYGEDDHLNFSPDLIFGNGLKHFFKHVFLLHYFPFAIKEFVYTALGNAKVFVPIILILLGVLGFVIKRFKSLSGPFQISSTSLVMFFMGIFPIVNLFFMYVIQHENDRYSYFAMPFFCIAIVSILYKLKFVPRYTILTLYLIIHMVLLSSMVKNARFAGEGCKALLENFPCERAEGKRVYFLAIPDNFNGMYMYRDFGEYTTSFKESMDLLYDPTCENVDYRTVAQYNFKYPSDIINAYFETEDRVRVFIGQNGTWFWKDGIGLSDYETENFKVVNKGWYFTVTFKDLSVKPLLLYPHGGEWKILEY